MNSKPLKKLSLILLALLISLVSIGCARTVKQTLPKMERDQVTLKVKLSPKPYLLLSDEQVASLLKWNSEITRIIFDNQANWFGIYDEASIIQKGYEDYVTNIL